MKLPFVVATDFNEELARATLLEHPNSFFLGTVAAEDVDSDSGYSSPQHRQTTAAPSDAAAASVAVGSQPAVVAASPQAASKVLEMKHNVQQPRMMSYTPDGRHLPMIYAPYPFQGPPSVNMFVPTGKGPKVAGNTSRPQSAGHRGGGGAKPRHRAGTKRTLKLQAEYAAKALMNSQATSVNGGVGNQVMACSEPALPFDDVDEFPYLLSAADGLIASQVASNPHPPSQPTTCRPVEVMKVDIIYK